MGNIKLRKTIRLTIKIYIDQTAAALRDAVLLADDGKAIGGEQKKKKEQLSFFSLFSFGLP